MSSRNTERHDLPETYYHVYARGINKNPVYLDAEDKNYFLYVISRHLSVKPVFSKNHYPYPNYRGKLELLSYCLMDNHFHLLIYQVEEGTLSAFMKSIMTGYCAYFNRKYVRTGSVFGSRYMASDVDNEAYLSHISRYIHLNPRSWRRYPYSSFRVIRQHSEPEWLQTERVLREFSSREEYADFVADYEANRDMLATIKHNLADK